ncbi:hypothetical protein DFJ73DRAFT_862876 [Zopfochytrium polystomum]|nr:hypothetical protein DFJ73DRAFT_862876 [Zopfochytrium polystomum]
MVLVVGVVVVLLLWVGRTALEALRGLQRFLLLLLVVVRLLLVPRERRALLLLLVLQL